jgi:Rieske Fe-S protein
VSENTTTPRITSRRAVVGGVVGLGLAAPLLAACGEDGSEGGDDSGTSTTSAGPIAKTTDVPVGGAKLYPAEKVMVSQPTEGDFRAFSTVCTHQGCPITKLVGDEIDCTCHGSRFSTKDGSVLAGPADKPLHQLKVTTQGEDISVS